MISFLQSAPVFHQSVPAFRHPVSAILQSLSAFCQSMPPLLQSLPPFCHPVSGRPPARDFTQRQHALAAVTPQPMRISSARPKRRNERPDQMTAGNFPTDKRACRRSPRGLVHGLRYKSGVRRKNRSAGSNMTNVHYMRNEPKINCWKNTYESVKTSI